MRQITFIVTILVSADFAATTLAAGVSLPAGPYPIEPGFGSNVTYTKILHVAITGNDGTGTGTSTQPYATANKALQNASPGTKVIIHQGAYTGYISGGNQGTALAPILVTSADGEGPVVLDRLGTGSEVMHLTDAAYIIFENLTFRRATGNGINIDDGGSYATPAHHIILRNLTVEDIGTGGNNDGIKLSGVDNVYVLGCLIQRIRSGSGIDMVGCHDSVIAYNTFSDLIEKRHPDQGRQPERPDPGQPVPQGRPAGAQHGRQYRPAVLPARRRHVRSQGHPCHRQRHQGHASPRRLRRTGERAGCQQHHLHAQLVRHPHPAGNDDQGCLPGRPDSSTISSTSGRRI